MIAWVDVQLMFAILWKILYVSMFQNGIHDTRELHIADPPKQRLPWKTFSGTALVVSAGPRWLASRTTMVLTFPCSPSVFPGYVISDILLFGPTLSTQPFLHTNVPQDFPIRLQFEFQVFCQEPWVFTISLPSNNGKDEYLIHDFIGIVFRKNSFGYQFHGFFPKETMTFGKNFSQKLDAVQLPENLQLLSSEPMGWTGWRLPPGLMGFSGAQCVWMGMNGDWWGLMGF